MHWLIKGAIVVAIIITAVFVGWWFLKDEEAIKRRRETVSTGDVEVIEEVLFPPYSETIDEVVKRSVDKVLSAFATHGRRHGALINGRLTVLNAAYNKGVISGKVKFVRGAITMTYDFTINTKVITKGTVITIFLLEAAVFDQTTKQQIAAFGNIRIA